MGTGHRTRVPDRCPAPSAERSEVLINMPKLSIIIPCHNEEKHLPDALSSIASQSFRDLEVIVPVRADTSDRTREIARDAGAWVMEGGDVVTGRNNGAARAAGDIFLFLDADTKFPNESFLKDAVAEIEERKLGVAAPDVATISDKWIDRFFFWIYSIYARLTIYIHPHAPGFCMFATRKAHEGINGFDPEVPFAEDHDYIQRAKRAGFKVGILKTTKPIPTSDRRFKKDGRLRTACVYIWTDIRMFVYGPYRKKLPFTYEMGGDAPEKK